VTGGGRQLGATPFANPGCNFAHFPGEGGFARDAGGCQGLLKAAIRSNDPVLFLEHATLYQTRGEVPDGDYVIPIGESKVNARARCHDCDVFQRVGNLHEGGG